MSEIRSLEQAADSARTMQAALSLGSHINRWSLLFALLALFCLFYLPLSWLPRTGLLVSVIANGVQMLFALRVALDEKLFRNLARQWAAASPGPPRGTTLQRKTNLPGSTSHSSAASFAQHKKLLRAIWIAVCAGQRD